MMGIGYDINSLYPHQMGMLKALESWNYEFSWKKRKSYTSGDVIWFEYAYKRVGTNDWLSSVDYIMYKLTQE
jgi:hypothetical protein